MAQRNLDRISNNIQKMSIEGLRELVLEVCEESALMRGRVINCLDGLDRCQDDSQRSNAQSRATAARNEAWKKAKLAEHKQQLQRSLACIKEAELALEPALKEIMKMKLVSSTQTQPQPSFQMSAAHQSTYTGQYPAPPPAPWPPMVTTTPGMIRIIPATQGGIIEQPTDLLCKNCNTWYHLAANHSMACRYHSGKSFRFVNFHQIYLASLLSKYSH